MPSWHRLGHRGRAARASPLRASRSSGIASRSSSTTAASARSPTSAITAAARFPMDACTANSSCVRGTRGSTASSRGKGRKATTKSRCRSTASSRATTASTSSCRRSCREGSSSTSLRTCWNRIPSRRTHRRACSASPPPAWTRSIRASRPPTACSSTPSGISARRAPTRSVIRLRDLTFRHCEGNYSKASHACTWPCAITERDPDDQLTPVYEGLVHWADVVLIATPIRWGNASLALLQDGRAAQLHSEPAHDSQPPAAS